jgi:hypothetical protein
MYINDPPSDDDVDQGCSIVELCKQTWTLRLFPQLTGGGLLLDGSVSQTHGIDVSNPRDRWR